MSIKDRLSKIRILPVIGVILILAAVFNYTRDVRKNAKLAEAANQIRYIASQPLAGVRMANSAVIVLQSQDTNEMSKVLLPFTSFPPDAVSNLVVALQNAQPYNLSSPSGLQIANTWSYALLFTNNVYAPFNATIYEDLEDDVYVNLLQTVKIEDDETVKMQIITNTPVFLPGAAPFFRETAAESERQIILMMEKLRSGGEE